MSEYIIVISNSGTPCPCPLTVKNGDLVSFKNDTENNYFTIAEDGPHPSPFRPKALPFTLEPLEQSDYLRVVVPPNKKDIYKYQIFSLTGAQKGLDLEEGDGKTGEIIINE